MEAEKQNSQKTARQQPKRRPQPHLRDRGFPQLLDPLTGVETGVSGMSTLDNSTSAVPVEHLPQRGAPHRATLSQPERFEV